MTADSDILELPAAVDVDDGVNCGIESTAVRHPRTRTDKPWRIRMVETPAGFDPYLWSGRPLALIEYVRLRYLIWQAGLVEGRDYLVEHRDGPGRWNAMLTRDPLWSPVG